MMDINHEEVPAHLTDLLQRSTQEVPIRYHQEIANLMIEFQDVFSRGDDDVGRTNLVQHRIDTGTQRPIIQRPRKHPLGPTRRNQTTGQRTSKERTHRAYR